jgi:hypothetical protein
MRRGTHGAAPAAPKNDEVSKKALKSAVPISRLQQHIRLAAWTVLLQGSILTIRWA